METKPLLYGLIGFFLGGLIVSIAATTGGHSTASLASKSGNDFDKAFISEMIEHHEGAIDMAALADKNAKHDEIKQLSRNITQTQQQEIAQMKRWQNDWGYSSTAPAANHQDHP